MLTWKAIYSDGGSLEQFNAGGPENSYKNIDRTKLSRFELYDQDRMVYSLFLREGWRLIFRRRNFISMQKAGEKRWVVYLVGAQFTDQAGKNHKFINYIHESGLVELDDDRKDLVVLPEES